MRMLKHDGEVTELKGDQYSGLLLNLLHYHNFISKLRDAQRPVRGSPHVPICMDLCWNAWSLMQAFSMLLKE
jgi:hypothetical protein